MDSTLAQILSLLFEYSQQLDGLRARIAELEGKAVNDPKPEAQPLSPEEAIR